MCNKDKINGFLVDLRLENRQDRASFCLQKESLTIINGIFKNQNVAALIGLFSRIDNELKETLIKKHVPTPSLDEIRDNISNRSDRYNGDKVRKSFIAIETAEDAIDLKKLLKREKYSDFESKFDGFVENYKMILLFDGPNLFRDLL